MGRFRKNARATKEFFNGKHRYEHWYRDNTVYFITARVRDQHPALESDAAKAIFWDRFNFYTAKHGFAPFVTSLMNNHYHTEGYLKHGEHLGVMMQKIHGSVAKLVNDPAARTDHAVLAGLGPSRLLRRVHSRCAAVGASVQVRAKPGGATWGVQ